MEYESTAASEKKISGVHLNKLGAYSNRKLTEKSSQPGKPSNPEKICYRCGMRITLRHMKQCKTINAKC